MVFFAFVLEMYFLIDLYVKGYSFQALLSDSSKVLVFEMSRSGLTNIQKVPH